MGKCSNCSAENKESAKFCVSCGQTLEGAAQTKRFCSTCGEEVPLGANFCVSCGAEVTIGKGALRPERNQAKARKKRVTQVDSNRTRKGVIAMLISIPIISLLFIQLMKKPGSTIPKLPTTPSGMPVQRGNSSDNEDAMAPVMQKLEELNERIDNDPTDFHAYLELGGMYNMIGRFEEASEYFESYIDLQPSDTRVRISLAEMYANSGNLEKAIMHLREASRIDPEDEFALYNLGIILASKGDTLSAKEAWQKLVDINPTSEIGISAGQNLKRIGK